MKGVGGARVGGGAIFQFFPFSFPRKTRGLITLSRARAVSLEIFSLQINGNTLCFVMDEIYHSGPSRFGFGAPFS